MSRCGDVYENKVTGEYVVVLRGTEDRGTGPGIAHLKARPGAAVVGEHRHPGLTERFTVIAGHLDRLFARVVLVLRGARLRVQIVVEALVFLFPADIVVAAGELAK